MVDKLGNRKLVSSEIGACWWHPQRSLGHGCGIVVSAGHRKLPFLIMPLNLTLAYDFISILCFQIVLSAFVNLKYSYP